MLWSDVPSLEAGKAPAIDFKLERIARRKRRTWANSFVGAGLEAGVCILQRLQKVSS